MNPLAILWLWRIGGAFLLVGSITAGYFGWRSHQRGIGEQTVQVKWDNAKKVQQAAADKATAENKAKEDAWKKKVKDAKDEDAKRIKKLAADAASARATADGLRGDLAAARDQMSRSTCDSVRQYANTLSVVFDQCTAEYQRVAQAADEHAAGLQLIMSSWPAK